MPSRIHATRHHNVRKQQMDLWVRMYDGQGALAILRSERLIAKAGKLSDEQIRSVIEYIKSTWPQRQRDYQDQRNQVQH